jgi:hypothetical protein
VIAREPAPELRVGVSAAGGVDLLDVAVVDRELDDHAIGIRGVERAAIAVLEHVDLRFDITGRAQPPFDLPLHVAVDLQRDVMERCLGQFWPKQLLVPFAGELKEGERRTVAQAEEQVAIGSFGAEQLIGLTPRGEQGQADDVFVELARAFEIAGDVGGVVQACG